MKEKGREELNPLEARAIVAPHISCLAGEILRASLAVAGQIPVAPHIPFNGLIGAQLSARLSSTVESLQAKCFYHLINLSTTVYIIEVLLARFTSLVILLSRRPLTTFCGSML